MGGELKLLSCPFCGGEAKYYGQGEGVICRTCHAQVLGAGNVDDVPTWNRRASPPPPSGSAWGVKPLVWSAGPSYSGMEVAKCVFGEYWVWGDAKFACWSRGSIPGTHAGDLPKAKAAAQADYEARISSAFMPPMDPLQARVQPWMDACFGPEISGDKLERGDRLLEEVFELLQSGEYPRERVRAMEDYVWSRPAGEPAQEVGGVMITLAAYCLAHGIDMHEAGETELARIWTKVDKIRAKQAAKPVGSALPIPVALTPSPSYAEGIEAAAKVADAHTKEIDGDPWDHGYQTAAENIAAAIRALAGKPPAEDGWLDISTAPKDGTEIIVALQVKHSSRGDLWWERHIVAFDESRGEISLDHNHGWEWDDYSHWRPLPAPPNVKVAP